MSTFPSTPAEMSRTPPVRTAALAAVAAVGGIGLAWHLDARRRDQRTALIHRTMVELLLNTLCAGDPSTARHSRRVADLTDVVGATFRMRGEAQARLRVAALLHDLGKLDDDVQPLVHSHHRLDEGERRQVKEHTNQSGDILKPLEALHPGISRIVESHHERWDGQGYPRGLSDTSIPLESRIISVADVFDAMTQPRSYKGPLDPEEALREIRTGLGSRFDPGVVERVEGPVVWDEWLRIVRRGRREELGAADGSETEGALARTGGRERRRER
jgi:HD-GYP domain-containing protein (c-di-GMP phosphodiesterase class II)